MNEIEDEGLIPKARARGISLEDILRIVERDDAPSCEDDFMENFYTDLRNAIKKLEDSKRFYCSDKEEKITNFLVNLLKQKGYQINAEVDINGHVDLVLDFKIQKDEYKWLCEAKIANGPEYLKGGMDQLFTRYSNPRYKHCGLLIYVQNLEFETSKKNWTEYIVNENLYGLNDYNFLDDFEFESSHNLISLAITTKLRHFWAYIYYNPKK